MGKALNKKWHKDHSLPKGASLKVRLQWHVDHARECACREIPEKIKKEMAKRMPTVVVGVLAKNKANYLLVRETS